MIYALRRTFAFLSLAVLMVLGTGSFAHASEGIDNLFYQVPTDTSYVQPDAVPMQINDTVKEVDTRMSGTLLVSAYAGGTFEIESSATSQKLLTQEVVTSRNFAGPVPVPWRCLT